MADKKKVQRPTEEHEMPQGVKNWDAVPQQVDGPNGPEPEPKPEDAGAGEVSWKKEPQQVDGPEFTQPEPQGRQNWDPKPQQVDGPEGPDPTDGTELIAAATGQKPRKAVKPPAKENVGSPSSLDGKNDPPKGHGSKDGDKSEKGHGSKDGNAS